MCARGLLHCNFWQRIAAERTCLITDEEAPGVGVDAAAASAFLQQHGGVETAGMLLSAQLYVAGAGMFYNLISVVWGQL